MRESDNDSLKISINTRKKHRYGDAKSGYAENTGLFRNKKGTQLSNAIRVACKGNP